MILYVICAMEISNDTIKELEDLCVAILVDEPCDISSKKQMEIIL